MVFDQNCYVISKLVHLVTEKQTKFHYFCQIQIRVKESSLKKNGNGRKLEHFELPKKIICRFENA